MRTISRDGGIAVRAIVGTRLVAEAARRHDTSPTATAALGRTLLGALLLAAGGKSGESVQIQFRGDGPLRSVVALADDAGRARGYVLRPRADPPRVNGELDVHNAVGAGVLTVVRQRPGQPPYTGVVQILYGTIARDLTHYLAESEQSRTAVALGVQEADAGGIQRGRGLLRPRAAGRERGGDAARRAERARDRIPPSSSPRARTRASSASGCSTGSGTASSSRARSRSAATAMRTASPRRCACSAKTRSRAPRSAARRSKCAASSAPSPTRSRPMRSGR